MRESRLLLAFVSPDYLQSEYCEWEFNEYVKNEVVRALVGEGVAPIYFVEVSGWQDKDFDPRSAEWIAEVRRRQHFDLRPWFHEGEESLSQVEVQGRMQTLNQRIAERIQRGERFEQSLGHQHPRLHAAIENYTALLRQMGHNQAQVTAELDKVGAAFGIQLDSDT